MAGRRCQGQVENGQTVPARYDKNMRACRLDVTFRGVDGDKPEIQDKASMSRVGENRGGKSVPLLVANRNKSTMLMMRFNQIVIEVLVRLVKPLKKPVNPPNAMQAIQSVAVA